MQFYCVKTVFRTFNKLISPVEFNFRAIYLLSCLYSGTSLMGRLYNFAYLPYSLQIFERARSVLRDFCFLQRFLSF